MCFSPAAMVDPRESARLFRWIFALILVTEYWARALPKWQGLAASFRLSLPFVTLVAAGAFTRWHRGAFAMLALMHARLVWSELPVTGNHAYLEVYLCALLAFLDGDSAEEAALLRSSVLWLAVIVFFYSGVQKLVHGYYFDGSMLTYSMSTNSFRPIVGLLIGPDELARISRFTGQPGDGPYASSSLPLIVAANGVWLAELILPVFLLMRRTRTVAIAGSLALITGIELAARELFFGLVFTNALILSAPVLWQRTALGLVALLSGALILSRAGILPPATFY